MPQIKSPHVKYPYEKDKHKGLMFFSASSRGDAEFLYKFGVREILVSFHYISKSLNYFDDLTTAIRNDEGLFMTDSGAFSFMSGAHSFSEEETAKPDFWIPYIEKYVQWLYDHKEVIYCAVNMDLDKIVGREVVDKWNEKYFEPLEKYMQIIYVAHNDPNNLYGDKNGLKRFKDYCSRYDYVGVNQTSKEYAAKIYTHAKTTKRRVHGFAWTDINLLKQFPLQSVDSTTWLGGVRYGTSYRYDGKNFRVIDYKRKYVRKADKTLCSLYGVNYEALLTDERYAVNTYNMLGWLGARREYVKMADLKLMTKPVSFYDKRNNNANSTKEE